MSSRGFGLLSFVFILPAVLTIVGVVSAGALLIKADSKLKHECRVQLLESQAQIASRLNKLISLNQRARRIIETKKVAQKSLYSGDAGSAAAAALMLTAAKVQQAALRAEQLALIIPSKTASTSTSWKAYRSMSDLAAKDSISKSFGGRPRLRSAAFAIRAIQPDELAPEYETLPDFSDSQTMTVDILFPIASFLPDWLKPFLKRTDLTLRANCSATLEKENGKWIAKLKADKS